MRNNFNVFYALLILACSTAFSSEPSEEPSAVFLTSRRSGTNLVSCCLNAITRKPIGLLRQAVGFPAEKLYSDGAIQKRLDLEMVSTFPCVYRTHRPDLVDVFSKPRRLIFLTRNPKELLFRQFTITKKEDLSQTSIQEFLNEYFHCFQVLESYLADDRLLFFYEDVVDNLDETLLAILNFLGEDPLFWEDYILHKEEYLDKILDSYKAHHSGTKGGISSQDGARAIYYTQNKDPELLEYIDQILEQKDPVIWEKYLKRFKTNP